MTSRAPGEFKTVMMMMELNSAMNKHVSFEDFKPPHEPHKNGPSWAWDADLDPWTPREAAGYVTGTHRLFRAFAIIDGLPVSLGLFYGRAAACRAIADAHGGGHE